MYSGAAGQLFAVRRKISIAIYYRCLFYSHRHRPYCQKLTWVAKTDNQGAKEIGALRLAHKATQFYPIGILFPNYVMRLSFSTMKSTSITNSQHPLRTKPALALYNR